jgi:hypothetical protein
MNNIIRRTFHVLSGVSYIWAALSFYMLSQISAAVGANDFVALFDVSVACCLVMVVASGVAGANIFDKTSGFVTLANTWYFTISALVYLSILITGDAPFSVDWILLATIAMAIFGWFTVKNPLVKPAIKST